MQKLYMKPSCSNSSDALLLLNTPMSVWYADIPYAWVNLRHGVGAEELTVQETNTAAVGSFTLEFGLLSRLTGQLASTLYV